MAFTLPIIVSFQSDYFAPEALLCTRNFRFHVFVVCLSFFKRDQFEYSGYVRVDVFLTLTCFVRKLNDVNL